VFSHVSPACLRYIITIYKCNLNSHTYLSLLERHIILICFNRVKYGTGNAVPYFTRLPRRGSLRRDHCTRGKGRKSVNVKMQIRAKYIISVYPDAFSNVDFFVRVMKPSITCVAWVKCIYAYEQHYSRPIILFEVRLMLQREERRHATAQWNKVILQMIISL